LAQAEGLNCYVVETEFWGQMASPNLLVEYSARDVADLVAAARLSDTERCRIVLDSVLSRRSVIDAWDEVCRPALIAVDADQRIDPDCMDIEHALSWAALGALHRVPRPPVSPDAPPVLLACVEAEHHTLPLAALSAALAGLAIAFLLQTFGVTAVFLFIAFAMIMVIISIGVFGPATRGLALEEISH